MGFLKAGSPTTNVSIGIAQFSNINIDDSAIDMSEEGDSNPQISGDKFKLEDLAGFTPVSFSKEGIERYIEILNEKSSKAKVSAP